MNPTIGAAGIAGNNRRLATRPEDLSGMPGAGLMPGITDPDLAETASCSLDTFVPHNTLGQAGIFDQQPGDAGADQRDRKPIGLKGLAEVGAPE
jgi:hypothetical protein